MARVVFTSTLKQFTGGVGEIEIEASNIRQLFTILGEHYPDLKPHLDEGMAVAIDGQMYQDTWLQPIPPDSEVFLLPQIAGG
jgi:molybdopterin converting factor small subunit